jgi:hypothetical protein
MSGTTVRMRKRCGRKLVEVWAELSKLPKSPGLVQAPASAPSFPRL